MVKWELNLDMQSDADNKIETVKKEDKGIATSVFKILL